MFHGFDPATRDPVFVRRSPRAIVLALFGHLIVIGSWAWRDRLHEPEVAVALEPEIKDFAVDDAPEPEPEIEDEPPPPPPDRPVAKPAAKPRPKPRLDPPKVIPDGPPPEQASPSSDKNFGTGEPGAGGGVKKAAPPPAKKADPPKKVDPPKRAAAPIDPSKPVDRPERASVPRPDSGNAMPAYPGELRDIGVEGEVVLKLHVHRDGTVKGAKILRATNTATGDDDKLRADKLFKAAVIRVVKGWTYSPSRLDGQPISVWIIVNFPFKLTGAN